MNYLGLALADLGGFAAYFVLGGLTFTVPWFRNLKGKSQGIPG
jgi:hypothetical protein